MISHRLSSNKVQNTGGERSEQNLFRGTGVKNVGSHWFTCIRCRTIGHIWHTPVEGKKHSELTSYYFKTSTLFDVLWLKSCCAVFPFQIRAGPKEFLSDKINDGLIRHLLE